MTVEEALVALLAAAAGILLFFGLAQALDGQPPDGRQARLRGVHSEGPQGGSARNGRFPVLGASAGQDSL